MDDSARRNCPIHWQTTQNLRIPSPIHHRRRPPVTHQATPPRQRHRPHGRQPPPPPLQWTLRLVPVGTGWTVDPFAALIRDGKPYGRGTCDQKAGIAASIYAIEAIPRAGIRLHGTVEQSGTVDEESGGFAGVACLARRGLIHREPTNFVIITEPSNVDRICMGHRGVYWFK